MSHKDTSFTVEIAGFGDEQEGLPGLMLQIAMPAAQKVLNDIVTAEPHIVSVEGQRLLAFKYLECGGNTLLGVLVDSRYSGENWLAVLLSAKGHVILRGPKVEVDVDLEQGTANVRRQGSATRVELDQNEVNAQFPVQQHLAELFGMRFKQAYITQAVVFALQAQGKTVTAEEIVAGDERQILITGVR